MCALPSHHNKMTTAISVNFTDIEGSRLYSYTDTLALQLVLASDKLDISIPSSAKLVISQDNRSDVFTTSKKTHGNSTD